MLWEQFVELRKDWMKRFPAEEVRAWLLAMVAEVLANYREAEARIEALQKSQRH